MSVNLWIPATSHILRNIFLSGFFLTEYASLHTYEIVKPNPSSSISKYDQESWIELSLECQLPLLDASNLVISPVLTL